MKKILSDYSFRTSIFITLFFFGTGLLFLIEGYVEYNWVLFLFLPVMVGISIGALPSIKWAMVGAITATVIFLLAIFIPGLSGLICIVMCMPLLIPFIFLSTVITHLVKRYKAIRSERFSLLLLPLLPFLIVAPTDKYLNPDNKQIVEVRTERIYDYTPEEVYDAIKSVDTLDAPKPWLMKFDLPVPTKCILEKEEVGGIRTCYFRKGNMSQGDFGGGTIRERITALERGKLLQMDVTDYNLIGRKWLGFKEAIYHFDKVGDHQCKLTRITTYTSELTPRLYWEPLERMGIEQEHDYVFDNLAKDLKKRDVRR